MAFRSRFVAIPSLALSLLFGSVASRAQTIKPVAPADIPALDALPSCVPIAQLGYIDRKCLVTIDRQSPISPPPLLVPPSTSVFVKVINTRWNEAVLFSLSTTHTTPPDIAGAALKGLISPLQSLVLTQKLVQAIEGPARIHDQIDDEQDKVLEALNSVQKDIQRATSALTCLSNYQTLTANNSCSQADLLTPDNFNEAEKTAMDLATSAATQQLPLLELKNLDTSVSGFLSACLITAHMNATGAAAEDLRKQECRDDANRHLTNEARLNSDLSDIQKVQSALLVSLQTLTAWAGTPPVVAYQFTSSKLNNMVVTVSGQEVVNKTNSAIATVTINCQATHWVVSTGILFSNLTFHTFTNAPIIVNGKPVLDSGGKVLTKVTRSDTSPSVVAPTLFLSYRIPPLSRFSWENKCRNGCSFLLTGGVGANLTSKTADFDSGISFQIGSVVLTPTVHYGRDNRLSNGVSVGTELGSSPPNPLPTENHWVKKFGIALTYTLPTP